MAKHIVVFITASSREEGERIARGVVREKLAACVNLSGPITSFFRWKGRATRAREVLLIAKTRRALFARLAARVRALHSYEVPEIIAIPVADGSSDYLRWVDEETASRWSRGSRCLSP